MNNIAICIPTYRRPVMLKKLLLSIDRCNINKSIIRNVTIIIVDNDACMTGKSIVDDLKEILCTNNKINYFSFPVKGLANVRNELIKKAFLLNPNFIVFVDDDEYVTSEWLNELVKTIVTNKGDMVMGPVNSSFENKGSTYISCWFNRKNYQNNTKLNFIRTGNLIIDAKTLLANNIWFDPQFNITGGEDSYFGSQMIKKGATVYWAANAIVFEIVPPGRVNIRWLIKRYYNGANIFTYILKVEKEYLKLSKKILVSLMNIIIGFCATIIVLVPFRKRYWGLLKVSEGLGAIAALFSIRYHEYK